MTRDFVLCFIAVLTRLFEILFLTRIVGSNTWGRHHCGSTLGEHVHLQFAAPTKGAHRLAEGVATTGIKHLKQ